MQQNSILPLSETLRRKQQEDAARFESQTQAALKEHAATLRQLSADALSEARGAIESESGTIEAALETHRTTLIEMAKDLRAMHEREAKRMRWILRVPLLIVILTSVIATAGIWGWWRYQQPWSDIRMNNGITYQVLKEGWTTTCTVKGQQRPCRPNGWND